MRKNPNTKVIFKNNAFTRQSQKQHTEIRPPQLTPFREKEQPPDVRALHPISTDESTLYMEAHFGHLHICNFILLVTTQSWYCRLEFECTSTDKWNAFPCTMLALMLMAHKTTCPSSHFPITDEYENVSSIIHSIIWGRNSFLTRRKQLFSGREPGIWTYRLISATSSFATNCPSVFLRSSSLPMKPTYHLQSSEVGYGTYSSAWLDRIRIWAMCVIPISFQEKSKHKLILSLLNLQ